MTHEMYDGTKEIDTRYETVSTPDDLHEVAKDFHDLKNLEKDTELALSRQELARIRDKVIAKIERQRDTAASAVGDYKSPEAIQAAKDDIARDYSAKIQKLKNDRDGEISILQDEQITSNLSDDERAAQIDQIEQDYIDRVEALEQEEAEEIAQIDTTRSRRDKRRARKEIVQAYNEEIDAKKALYRRVMELFEPLVAGGMEPKIEYTVIEEDLPLDGSPVDTEKKLSARTSHEGTIDTVTVVTKQPDSPKATKKMEHLLRRKRKDREKVMHNMARSTDNVAATKGAKVMTDMYAQLITTMTAGEGRATLKDPESLKDLSCAGPGSVRKRYTRDYYNDGGLLKHIDFLDRGQKNRTIQVATLVAAGATVWAIVDLFRGKKWAKAFLGGGIALGAASYIAGGKFKRYGGLIQDVLGGGDLYNRYVERGNALGLKREELGSHVPGYELESLMVVRVGKVLGPLRYRELYAGNYIAEKDGKLCMVGDGKTAKLATYRANQGNKKNAKMAQALYEEQLNGMDHLNVAVEIMGNKDAMLHDKESNKRVSDDIQLYQQRADLLSDYMYDHKVLINPDRRTLVDDYLAGRSSSLRNLASNKAFISEDSVDRETSYLSPYYPKEQQIALDAMGMIRADLAAMSVSDFRKYTRFQGTGGINIIELDWAALKDDYPGLVEKYDNETKRTNFEVQLNAFLSQVLATPDNESKSNDIIFDQFAGKNMEDMFATYEIFFSNYIALGKYATDQRAIVALPAPEVQEYLGTDYTGKPTERNAAIAAILKNPDLVVFHASGYPELQNITPNPRFEVFFEQIDDMPATVKAQFIRWGSYFQDGLDGVPTLTEFRPGPNSHEIIRHAHGQDITINRKTNTLSSRYNDKEEWYIPNASVAELMQTAQFVNFVTNTYQGKSRLVAPRERDGNQLEFEYRERLSNTEALSPEGMEKYFPDLIKTDRKEEFVEWLNSMVISPKRSLWLKETQKNPDLGPIISKNPDLGPIISKNPDLGPIISKNPDLGPEIINDPSLIPGLLSQ